MLDQTHYSIDDDPGLCARYAVALAIAAGAKPKSEFHYRMWRTKMSYNDFREQIGEKIIQSMQRSLDKAIMDGLFGGDQNIFRESQ